MVKRKFTRKNGSGRAAKAMRMTSRRRTTVEKQLGMERKFHDATDGASDNLVASFTGGEHDPATANCLNGIAQGDGESNRDGRKYIMKKVQVVGKITRSVDSDQADTPGGVGCWVALVLDTQTNGGQLNSEDVYTGTVTDCPMRNLQYVSRYKVLGFKQFAFDAPNVGTDGASTLSSGGQIQHFRWDKDIDIPVTCSGTGATVADIVDNSLHVIGGASASAAPNQVAVRYNSRVRFVG